jgi:hypothetical protein
MANLDNRQIEDVCYLLDIVAARLTETNDDGESIWPRHDMELILSDVISSLRSQAHMITGIDIKRSVLAKWRVKGY